MHRITLSLILALAAFAAKAEYKLVWQDEFESLDADVWIHEIGTGDNGWGNFEQETYTDSPANSYVEGSILHISAKRIPNTSDRVQYTSARLKTQGNLSILYGKVEARMKLPQRGQGVWPALWMLGEEIEQVGWPYCGEIDIMEWKGAEPYSIVSTSHWNGNPYAYEHCNYGSTLTLDFALDADFYIYGVEWTPIKLEYYMIDANGQRHTINVIDISGATVANGLDCFHKPQFLLLNLAMGGQFGGDVTSDVGDRTFLIDWVRIYQDTETFPSSALSSSSISSDAPIDATHTNLIVYRSGDETIIESSERGMVDIFSYDGKLIRTILITEGQTILSDLPRLSIIRLRK